MNEDMPGLDTDMVVHHFPLRPECKPKKQKFRRMKMAVQLKIKEEVQTETTQCRISNGSRVAKRVPIPKKDGKVRKCVDYRNLNRASPKDDFPLPHIEMLVDNTAGHE